MSQPTVIANPRTIGFDLGSRSSVFCALDESGEVSEEGTGAMSRSAVAEFFAEQAQSRVVLEASGSSRWSSHLSITLGL